MAKKKLSNKQIKDIVEYEGLGYAIQHYLGSEMINNKKLSKLWGQTKKSLDAIAKILKLGEY
jgi:hypothetical protein